MAQRIISGTTGNVTFTGITGGCKLTTWSASISQAVADCTGYDDDVYGRSIGMQNIKMSGSCGGFLTEGTTSDQPNHSAFLTAAGGIVTLQAKTGCTFAAVVIVSDISISHSREGVATIAFNFISDGVITETWATT